MIIIYILILLFLLYQQVYPKEGILFRKPYLLKKYKKENIILDKENTTLEKDGKKINYKQINTITDDNWFIDIKPITNNVLRQNNIPVSKSYTWNNALSSDENLLHVQHLNFPLVVKPTNGQQGYGVTTDIMTKDELLECVTKLTTKNKEVLIEEQATGKEYRITVFNDNVIGITMKTHPFITGDGIHSVDELIAAYNDQAGDFKIHTVDYNYIKHQGYLATDILPPNEKIIITHVANMSNGSIVSYVDINTVHPLNISLFKQINRVLGLKLSGIDYICEDLSIPYHLSGCVIEVNPKPGIDIHYNVFPDDKKESFLDTIIHNLFY